MLWHPHGACRQPVAASPQTLAAEALHRVTAGAHRPAAAGVVLVPPLSTGAGSLVQAEAILAAAAAAATALCPRAAGVPPQGTAAAAVKTRRGRPAAAGVPAQTDADRRPAGGGRPADRVRRRPGRVVKRRATGARPRCGRPRGGGGGSSWPRGGWRDHKERAGTRGGRVVPADTGAGGAAQRVRAEGSPAAAAAGRRPPPPPPPPPLPLPPPPSPPPTGHAVRSGAAHRSTHGGARPLEWWGCKARGSHVAGG